ncbi:DUF6086 family protein [Streptomyces sp. CBMA123]|uniref:DUF6086 family protein n=1 Tax=Streptomyces sp. CBMA123 TaxID=1896313 RepID=UPI001661F9EB|nr:DUF6086 family protein [Streptomyces sp. CBMA123]MBD0695340.1 hypothetical protein [Streptomyces sp. CBMA123]
MSQYYAMGGVTLWNPSNGASRLFLRQLAVFEEELGLSAGIGPMESDECRVHPVALGVFANALLAHQLQSRHAVIRALGEGFTMTVLALAGRAGAVIDWGPGPEAAGLRAKVRELDRCMTG